MPRSFAPDARWLERIVVEAGELIKGGAGKGYRGAEKVAGAGDVSYRREKAASVPQDELCQRFILERVAREYPGLFGVVVEEAGAMEGFLHRDCFVDGRYTLIVDPIDGTANYASDGSDGRDCRYWGVSAAVAQGSNLIGGAVFYPLIGSGVVLRTQKGGGTWVDGKRVRVNAGACFDAALPVRIGGAVPDAQRMRGRFAQHRSSGSFVVSFLGLLRGTARIDVDVEGVCSYVGAGAQVVDLGCAELAWREAGGVVVDWTGRDVNLLDRVVRQDGGLVVADSFVFAPGREYAMELLRYAKE